MKHFKLKQIIILVGVLLCFSACSKGESNNSATQNTLTSAQTTIADENATADEQSETSAENNGVTPANSDGNVPLSENSSLQAKESAGQNKQDFSVSQPSAQSSGQTPATKPQASTSKPVVTTKPFSTTTKPSVSTTVPSTTKPQNNGNTNTGFEQQMLQLVNNYRTQQGLSALTLDKTLSSNAQLRAKEISTKGNFSHTRPDGTKCFTAITIPYSLAGENIAYGQPTVASVMEGWMNSEGHRANILKPTFTKAGFGCYEVNGTKYWAQFFVG